MQQGRTLGFTCALFAVLIWSGNFIIASGFTETIPPITLAALRWTTAAIAFLPFAFKHIVREREALFAYKWQMLLAAFSGVTMFNTLVYVSAWTTDTVNMALFASATPIFVVILSRIFLNEIISLYRTLGLIIAISGMFTIATDGQLSVLLNMTFRMGDLWMLLAGLLWATYSIIIKKKPEGISNHSFLGTVFTVGAIPLIPAAVIGQQYYPAWTVTPIIVGATLYIGLGASLTSFFLWNKAVGSIGPGTASLFQYLLPVFSGVGAYLILGEDITIPHAIGFVLILGGVYLATRSPKTQAPNQ